MIIENYQNQISSFLFSTDITLQLYWKARVGLYALLKAMGVREGDEVILPAYTCVVVPNAIIYLKAKPVYVDVSRQTYNMELEQVNDAITDRTKVIICQNTYGLSSDLEALGQLAKERGLYTIEDCTHGFGGTYNGIPNGLSCDAAIYSTQWNKPFSTGVGGFVVTRSTVISEGLRRVNAELIQPKAKELLNLKLLYFVRRYLINDLTYWPMVEFYRWLSRKNMVVGSSSGEEVVSVEMPDGYFKGFSNVQAKEGLRTLTHLAADMEIRKQTAALYTSFLQGIGKNHVSQSLFDNHSFLKYPLLVHDRDAFLSLAAKNRIELGEWFSSPLHPVEDDLSPWHFNIYQFPVAHYLSKHVVNLPTTPNNVNRVTDFLRKHVDLIV